MLNVKSSTFVLRLSRPISIKFPITFAYRCFLELPLLRWCPIFRRGAIIFNQPVVVPPVCVPDNVVKYNEPLELQLELPLDVHARWFTFESTQPKVGILEPLNEQLI